MGIQFSEEEKAYRRGFDQGIAFLLMDIGLTNKLVQEQSYKRRVGWWRHGRVRYSCKKIDPAPRMSEKEAKDLRAVILYCLTEVPQLKEDA